MRSKIAARPQGTQFFYGVLELLDELIERARHSQRSMGVMFWERKKLKLERLEACTRGDPGLLRRRDSCRASIEKFYGVENSVLRAAY